ncbi:DUF4446 family protein [Alicyclobacillus macrosporangiidus]|uniref:DUF4446 family protein n=1 Tax=Alicyclobacillus macrosporangiidus TaxID=392015 RepID=UPI000495ACEB|nr:DUF4446 family protein [Alicyclobacillus macrosporangiidus]
MPDTWSVLQWGSLAAWVLALIAFILSCVACWTGSRLNRRFRKWKSIHATADLEEVYARTLDRVSELEGALQSARAEIEQLRAQLERKISTARVIRYNAFADTGSDLSFSIALLDDHADGVVISSIYGREESRTYAKPVKAGESAYPLTDEERQVIEGLQPNPERKSPIRV